MAITKILYMKDCGNHNPGKHLKQAIDYILVPEKTEEKLFVSGINCQTQYAYEQMKATKVQFGKTDKRQGYHIIISFEEGEVDAATAFEIVGRFADEYLKDRYEAVYAVHDNTVHIHGHIIFNSVSFVDGKKFRYEKGDWAKYIQPITNRLCEEYGLSTICVERDRAEPSATYTEWQDIKDGTYIWADMIRRDLDACILQASDFEGFLELLRSKGYEVKQNKYLTIKPPGLTRFKRCFRLGENYTEDRIRERIEMEDIRYYSENHTEARIVKVLFPYHLKRAKLTGMQRTYFAKLYRAGRLKSRPYSQAYKYRDEIRKMHRLHEQYMFLADYGIHTEEDLKRIYDELKAQRKVQTGERKQFYQEKSGYNGLWKKSDRMMELLPAERSFLSGDTFFEKEHDEYTSLTDSIEEEGYSLKELEELRTYYAGRGKLLQIQRTDLNKKIRIVESLIRETEIQKRRQDRKREIEKTQDNRNRGR